MKAFLQTFTGSIVSGFASYYLVLGCFNTLLWLFDYELTTAQRIFATENGYLAFVAGIVVGIVVFWRIFRSRT
tara:strand:- start:43 stop:261 length:219 start_codon:yes stop_codon:yes gene_type:complete